MDTIGKIALALAVATEDEVIRTLIKRAQNKNYHALRGQVGTMRIEKVIAAVETAARREGLISTAFYRENHAIYHATLEALYGICRGQLGLGDILRTAGLCFSVVKGTNEIKPGDKDQWLAVAFYGSIGAPIKGFEHEAVGLGIMHC